MRARESTAKIKNVYLSKARQTEIERINNNNHWKQPTKHFNHILLGFCRSGLFIFKITLFEMNGLNCF